LQKAYLKIIKNSGVFHLIKSQLNKLKDNTFDRFQDKNINIYAFNIFLYSIYLAVQCKKY